MITVCAVTETPLDTAAHIDAVSAPVAGANALFIGTVRNHDPEAQGEVTELMYSSHPDAPAILYEILAPFDQPDLHIAVSHRIGSLKVGDIAIICAVSSPHREEGISTMRAIVDTVKAELPIWKKQRDLNGETSWIGLRTL